MRSAFLPFFVDSRTRPGVGPGGRIGRDEDDAVVGDRGAEAGRGTGDRLDRAGWVVALGFPFDAGDPDPEGVARADHVPALAPAGRLLGEGERVEAADGDAERVGGTGDPGERGGRRFAFGQRRRGQLAQGPLRSHGRTRGHSESHKRGDRAERDEHGFHQSILHLTSPPFRGRSRRSRPAGKRSHGKECRPAPHIP